VRRAAVFYFLGFVLLTVVSGFFTASQSGLAQQFGLAIFSASLSVAMAVAIVNLLLDQKSRKLAAGPLARLVSLPIVKHHNAQILWGREKFGTADFNKLIDKYESNGHNPIAFSPSERDQFAQMISENIKDIESHHTVIEERLREMIGVLGWSFDAKIIAAALNCQQNIADFRLNNPPEDDNARLKLIEMYIDIDSSATTALSCLYAVLGKEMGTSDRLD
jgi:hypothetical protein